MQGSINWTILQAHVIGTINFYKSQHVSMEPMFSTTEKEREAAVKFVGVRMTAHLFAVEHTVCMLRWSSEIGLNVSLHFNTAHCSEHAIPSRT